MKESKVMTLAFKGYTEDDVMEWLDERGTEYTWKFSSIGDKSTIEWENKIAEFEKNICKKVLTNTNNVL